MQFHYNRKLRILQDLRSYTQQKEGEKIKETMERRGKGQRLAVPMQF